ncbi:MAG: HAD family phosphatase [Myxococcota bacterium]
MTPVFDVGNVLIRWEPRRVYSDLADHEIDDFFDEVGFFDWNREQDRGRSWPAGVRSLCEQFPHRAALIERFADRWSESVPGPIQGMPMLLQQLKRLGVKMYAITNFSASTWAKTCRRFAFLTTTFEDVVVSAQERLVKPDPRIYNLLLRRNGLSASQCLFIDDSEANVDGAHAVGMQAIVFRDVAQVRSTLQMHRLL